MMFFSDDVKSVRSRLLRKLRVEPRRIKIRDIVIFSYPGIRGEHLRFDAETTSQLARIIAHIDLLVSLAKEHHELDCMTDPDIITRLSTAEFYFYTKTPLTVADFGVLLEYLEQLAPQLQDNILLLFGTFAIQIDNAVLNMLIEVRCGQNYQLKTRAKNINASADPFYFVPTFGRDLGYFGLRDVRHFIATEYGIVDCNPINEVIGSNGARFLNVTEICLEHHFAYGKKNLDKLLVDAVNGDTGQIPLNVEHTLCANSLVPEARSQVSANILCVDPRLYMTARYRNWEQLLHSGFFSNFGADNLQQSHLEQIAQSINDKYRGLHENDVSLTTDQEGVVYINNPFFGEGNSHCYIYEIRELPLYNQDILNKVMEINNQVAERMVERYLAEASTSISVDGPQDEFAEYRSTMFDID